MANISMSGICIRLSKDNRSFGFNLGYGFNENGNALLGLDYRYNLTDEVRLAPSLSYFVKDDGFECLGYRRECPLCIQIERYVRFLSVGRS